MIQAGTKVSVSYAATGRDSTVSGTLRSSYDGTGPVEVLRSGETHIVPEHRVVKVNEVVNE